MLSNAQLIKSCVLYDEWLITMGRRKLVKIQKIIHLHLGGHKKHTTREQITK
jgi:hypothetical protein